MAKRTTATAAKQKAAELEERVESMEGVLTGLAVLTLVFTAEGQLVRVVSSHAQSVEGLKGAKFALLTAGMQMDDMLLEAVRREATSIPEVPVDTPE